MNSNHILRIVRDVQQEHNNTTTTQQDIYNLYLDYLRNENKKV
jgi:hypothetical protein